MTPSTRAESCGCCEGVEKLTPLATANRPGLDALAYRVGTHGSFLATMRARLTTQAFPDTGDGPRPRPLDLLTARSGDDPAIALLDAWATVADVLSFYQERVVRKNVQAVTSSLIDYVSRLFPSKAP